MNELNLPGLPVIKLKEFTYDETAQELTVNIEPDETLNTYVGGILKKDGPATHDEMEAFFVNIIIKALEQKDGYDFQEPEKDQDQNDSIV